jgi:hypothetical protein
MGLKNFFRNFKLACQAFFRAFKEPEKMQMLLDGQEVSKPAEVNDRSHLHLLYYLQHSGRLIDFLKEDITAFTDAQVGAAVRKIHQDCAQIIEELVTIRTLRDENEGATIQIHKGYNPAEIKIVGKIKGEPPFTGTLVHKGWKAHKLSLPRKAGEQLTDVICPAEVEVK